MEVLFELIFGRLITQYLGLNTRYYFFKMFNSNLEKENLTGDKNDNQKNLGQSFYNSFVGLIMFCLIAFLVVYILDLLGIL